MEENANGMASTNGVVIFRQILLESIWISCLYYIHAHLVQRLDRFVYCPMFLVIVHVIEPDTE
jgi:predicted PurR-regulated permease PerM